MSNTPDNAPQLQPKKRKQSAPVVLRDSVIEQRLSLYPADTHDAVRWLARYVREQCGGDLKLLENRCRILGLQTSSSETYFTKILNFTYLAPDENGKRLGQTAVDNFLSTVAALQRDQGEADAQGRIPFVETSVDLDVLNYIDARRADGAVCKWGIIAGHTGTGKTATTKYAAMRDALRVRHLDSPATGSLAHFTRDLAKRYGEQKPSTAKNIESIEAAVRADHVIIVDNAQRLHRRGQDWYQPVFNYLQKLQDDTGCTVILTCTLEFVSKRFLSGSSKAFFEQFVGRIGGVDEIHYMPEELPKADILKIAQAYKIENPEQAVDYLHDLAGRLGKRRILFHRLQRAAVLAKAENAPLSIDLIQALGA